LNLTMDRELNKSKTMEQEIDEPIYELEQICADLRMSPNHKMSRFVHTDNIGFYTTVEVAEAAMHAYIRKEKARMSDKDYHRSCLGFQIAETMVYNYPNVQEEPCLRWKCYTSDGELNKDCMR